MQTLPPLPTNSIVRQKLDTAAEAAARKSLEDSISGLRALCHSDKFRNEPYINVADVLLWAEQAISTSRDAEQAVYVAARVKQVLIAAEDIDRVHTIGLAYVFKLNASDIEGPRATAFYCTKENLDLALEALRNDGYAFVTVEKWKYGSEWSWEQKVTL